MPHCKYLNCQVDPDPVSNATVALVVAWKYLKLISLKAKSHWLYCSQVCVFKLNSSSVLLIPMVQTTFVPS